MIEKTNKIKAVNYFLSEVMNTDYPLYVRKEEMLRMGSKFCQGFPEWSDWWGIELEAIDDTSKDELRNLLDEIE